MSVEINKALARRFVMEHNQEGYTASFEELLTPDCVVHEYLPGLPDALNRDAYHQFIAAFRSALPDVGNAIEDTVTEGDKVVVYNVPQNSDKKRR
jgi:predicted ester cyclase